MSSRIRALVWPIVVIAVGGLIYYATSARPKPRPKPVTAEKASAPRPVDRPAVATPVALRAPTMWAVVAGIDAYSDPSIPACHGAEADARTLADWLVKTAGWPTDHVLRLESRGQEAPPKTPSEAVGPLRPVRANLEWALRTWLPSRVQPGDAVLIWFSGQAVAVAPGPDDPAGVPVEFLLPADARRTAPARTSWDLVAALDPVASTGKATVLVALDTSLSGRGRPVLADEEAPPAGRFLQRLSRWPGTAAWIAADGHVAPEAARPGQTGPFLGAILESVGTAAQPAGLLAVLDNLNRRPELQAVGFRAVGGLAPAFTIWSGQKLAEAAAARELLLQRGHAAGVHHLRYTPDGSRLISAGQDSVLRIWRPSDRRLLRALPYHLVGVTSLALDPGGRYVFSGDASGRQRIWDLARHRERPTGAGHEMGMADVVSLPGGARFVSLDRDGRAWLWDLGGPEGRPASPLSGRTSALAVAIANGPAALVLATTEGALVPHGNDGKPGRSIPGPGGPVTTARLATDGRRIATAGDGENPRLAVRSASGTVLLESRLSEPVQLVRWVPDGLLAVASGKQLTLTRFNADKPGPPATLDLPDPLAELSWSPDGRWLAGCTRAGKLLAWRRGDGGGYTPLELDGAGETVATSVSLSPDGRTLAVGGQDGGLRFWWTGGGERLAQIPARRGQIVGLDVSADARYLLQVTLDRQAQVWDLAEGRALTDLGPGWLAGRLVPDGSSVVLIDAESGDVVQVDRATRARSSRTFERPDTAGAPCRFGVLAVSPDPEGSFIAAGSLDGPLEGPVACVWERATGRLLRAFSGHEAPHPLTAVEFSADGRQLLSASEDGRVLSWDLNAGDPQPRPVQTWTIPSEDDPEEPAAVLAARFQPGGNGVIYAGTRGGRVIRLEPGNAAGTVLAGRFDGAVRALAFTRDGRTLAATGGLDRNLHVWSLGDRPEPLRLTPSPNHDELAQTLVGWPVGNLLASAGDDTTVRLWNLEDRRLLGTLSAEQGTPDWVAFTPEGLFDCSIAGAAQVSWLVGDQVLSFEQFEATARVFQLTDRLRRGVRPAPPALPAADPPHIALERPDAPVTDTRDLNLTLVSDEPSLKDLRLYHDGVPVAAVEDLTWSPDARTARVPVRLRRGVNRFHAMASRPDGSSIDGRSNVVEVVYDGPGPSGRVHVLALGVSSYQARGRALQFADHDAESLATFVHENGLQAAGEPGLLRVLTNEKVSEAAVDSAFREMRDAVAGRPDDTVVVFLAGHTDVLARRYYLLLRDFAFPDRPGATAIPTNLDTRTVLPYASIYRNLARLSALQRMVVVDACQSEAINDDPAVRRIREAIDNGSRQARTAYFLAARRGEPAGEASALEHGLLTYVLLRGMGDRSLNSPPELTVFRDLPDADRDLDKQVSSAELSWYAEAALPPLASQFPQVVMRSGINLPSEAGPVRPAANLLQQPRVQATGGSFPLVALPR